MVEKHVRCAFTVIIISICVEFSHSVRNSVHNLINIFILVIQSGESEVQTETKPDEDNPGGCFNWSKL